jgi:hypothetical protein
MYNATIEDTVYFWFASNDTSGSGNDGAGAAADVRLAGAAAGAAPILSPSPTLLSHANFPAGCYEVAVAATVANGFAATNTYAVFCTLAVDSQNPTGFIGAFVLGPVISNVKQISDDAVAADNLELQYDSTGLSGATFPATQAQATSILGDTNELQTDWADGGRLDLILDSRSDFDETTDPVELLDSGGSAGTSAAELVVDVWNALTATMTTAGSIGKLIVDNLAAAGSLAAAVWSYATRTLTDPVSSTDATTTATITRTRGNSWSIERTLSVNITGFTEIWFTVKSTKTHTDAESKIQITQSSGLAYLNGADASARAANGAITVSDALTGVVVITLDEAETDDLEELVSGYFDVQVLLAGDISTPDSGTFNIDLDVTRSIS